MLKIRLFKTGRKNQPFYRIVVTDQRNSPQGGRFKEKLGFLNPFTKEKNFNEERISYWLSVGAQPSDRVHNMLVEANLIKGKKINVLKKKASDKKTEEGPAPTKVVEDKKEIEGEEKAVENPTSSEETNDTEKEADVTDNNKDTVEKE